MITTFLNDTAMDRFQNMHQISKYVKSELIVFNKLSLGAGYSVKATSFLEQKINNKPIRAYFMTKIGEWVLAEKQRSFSQYKRNEVELNKLLNAQLPFVFEAVITIQYLHNQILDAKAGVVTLDRISENLLSANLLKDQLYRYINEELPTWAASEVERSVRRCFEYVDIGQMLEIKANRYTTFAHQNIAVEEVLPAKVLKEIDLESVGPFINKLKADLPDFLHDQLDVYFNRIYLSCAFLFVEGTSLVGRLLKLSDAKLRPLLQFSSAYGLMRQLVNDNADWVPGYYGLCTAEKIRFDNFSDLRNSTLTLPTILFLAEQKDSLIHNVLAKKMPWDSSQEQQLFDIIIGSQALYRSIQNVRILGEVALAFLPEKLAAAKYLAGSCEIVHWNKFLVPCLRHPAYKEYRKTAYHKQTKRLVKSLRGQRLEDRKKKEEGIFKMIPLNTQRETVFPLSVHHLHHLINKEISYLLSRKVV